VNLEHVYKQILKICRTLSEGFVDLSSVFSATAPHAAMAGPTRDTHTRPLKNEKVNEKIVFSHNLSKTIQSQAKSIASKIMQSEAKCKFHPKSCNLKQNVQG